MAATLKSEFEMMLPTWTDRVERAEAGETYLKWQGQYSTWNPSKVVGPDAWLNRLKKGYKVADKMMHNPKTGGYCCLGVYASACGVSDGSLAYDASFFFAAPWLLDEQTEFLAKANDSRRKHPIKEIERMLPLLRRQYRLWKKEHA